jgi:hypothetical protein
MRRMRRQSIERIAERGGFGWSEIGIIFDELKRKNSRLYSDLRQRAAEVSQ